MTREELDKALQEIRQNGGDARESISLSMEEDIKFLGMDFSNLDLSEWNLKYFPTVLSNHDFTEVNFSNCNMTNVDLNGPNLKDAILTETNISGMDFDNAVNLTQEQLDRAWAYEDNPPINLLNELTFNNFKKKDNVTKTTEVRTERATEDNRIPVTVGGESITTETGETIYVKGDEGTPAKAVAADASIETESAHDQVTTEIRQGVGRTRKYNCYFNLIPTEEATRQINFAAHTINNVQFPNNFENIELINDLKAEIRLLREQLVSTLRENGELKKEIVNSNQVEKTKTLFRKCFEAFVIGAAGAAGVNAYTTVAALITSSTGQILNGLGTDPLQGIDTSNFTF